MRILHINSYYAASGSPGFYKNLYEAQIQQGLDIIVFVPVSYELKPYKKEQFGEYTQVAKTHNPLDRYIFHLKHSKILKEARKRFVDKGFDIIHAHSLFSNGYVAWNLSKVMETPYIVAVRSTDIYTFFRYMPHLRGMALKILGEAKGIVFLNKPHKNILLDKYIPESQKQEIESKSDVIGNGIDDFWHENKYQKPRKSEGSSFRLLTVGKIIRRKNNLTVAKAAEILINRGYHVTYTIVGEQKDKKIYNILQEYSFVRCVPPKPKEELINYYRDADVFVLPSITETFGLVYAEAMTQGLPVIYSKGQGFDRQFEEGAVGFHVESRNAEEIADRIEDIMSNYQNISKNCVRLSDRFNWSEIAREYENLYRHSLE